MKQKTDFERTSVNQVKRVAKRGHYDRETVYEILDANLVGNVGFASEEGPFVIPMLFARRGDELLFHGSTKSRLMQMLCSGQRICVSVTLLDGLVLAKSLFHHSMNYRSVSAFGTGYEVTSESDRLDALQIISDKVMLGRWEDARQPNAQEMKATCVAVVKIDTASAKIRTGPPIDDQEDMELPVWSGVIPFSPAVHVPIPAPEDKLAGEVPQYMRDWQAQFNKRSLAATETVPGSNSSQEGQTNNQSVLNVPESYQARSTKMIGVREISGWQLKVYFIALNPAEKLTEQMIEAALSHIENSVTWPGRSQGYGFVTIHFGEQIWLLVDLWVDDILRHFIFQGTDRTANHFKDAANDGTTACVWELEITKHERDAWVKHVLSRPDEPSFQDYLNDKLEI